VVVWALGDFGREDTRVVLDVGLADGGAGQEGLVIASPDRLGGVVVGFGSE